MYVLPVFAVLMLGLGLVMRMRRIEEEAILKGRCIQHVLISLEDKLDQLIVLQTTKTQKKDKDDES